MRRAGEYILRGACTEPPSGRKRNEMKNTRMLAAAAVASLLAAPVLAEDLTIVSKTTGAGGAGSTTQYFASDKVRTGDGENETIMDYAAGRIVTVDHRKKEYSEITFAEMEAGLKAIAAQTDQMQEQMASMPPAVREKMEQMMGGAASSVTVTRGGTRQVAGYTCQDYTLAMGQAMTTRICATTALQYPVDYRKHQALAGSAAAMANNPLFKGMGKMVDEMKKIEGFTIAESTSMKMMGRTMESSKEAVEIKKGPIPAAAFDVAAITKGYKKVPHPVTKLR
jgi:hypothetical protein